MRRFVGTMLVAAGCWGTNAYIVEGVVVSVNPPSEVVIRHEAVPGLMDAMTMPFAVRDPALLRDLEPGDPVYARLIADRDAWWLAEIREHAGRTRPHLTDPPPEATPDGATPEGATPEAPAPLRVGQVLPSTVIPTVDGASITVGAGQQRPVLLTFLYTTCPRPEFCPALAARLQALQASLTPGEADLVSVTVDPDGDTLDVLRTWSESVGASSSIWRVGRLPPAELKDLAMRAALTVDPGTNEIIHSLRTLVLDKEGRLIERYDDARFPSDRVLQQLRTGVPLAPPGSDGTVTPAP